MRNVTLPLEKKMNAISHLQVTPERNDDLVMMMVMYLIRRELAFPPDQIIKQSAVV